MNALVPFLESFLGQSQKGSGSNYKFCCPFEQCKGKDSNKRGDKKFEINTEIVEVEGKVVNKWACWVCGNKGTTVYSLLRSLKVGESVFKELESLIKYSDKTKGTKTLSSNIVKLPSEYISLAPEFRPNTLEFRRAMAYLKKRSVTNEDIIKYSIGFCENGDYSGRIIVPLFDKNGIMNYFVARSISDDVFPKYKYPNVSRDIVPNELFINENEPILICEGIFDAISIKRNAIPLLGKEFQEALMIKIIKAPTKKIYLALDPDALKQMVKYAEQLLACGKRIFTVDMQGYKDAGEMGFVKFTEAIQKAKRLTESDLMTMKLNLLYE